MEQGRIVPDPPKYDRSRPLPQVELAYQYKLPNIPGKSSIGLMVTFPPNSSTPPHTHAGAAVSAVVLQGTLLNKMNSEPTRVFSQGGSWFEAPGCHHVVSDNYSKDEPAKLLATLIVDTEVVDKGGVEALVVFDDEYKDVALH
ncbi:cupin domain protein [Metarhizium robertsii]|uniref:Cupin domain protein n=3 Tax=Metarhizium TaxID=5529 RepID=E9F384_METRA|nr:cupin domain protein [Metarhizium robertsii ARSEF 23]EFY97950.1 cupin domain protein [Metarhizium robertsii ARSEF 23]EXU97517.1 cupin domain protein [Metarhizium robertsii]KID83096.1 cupin domain-containing protein [Metarhizium guizhouense ARSEF 977]